MAQIKKDKSLKNALLQEAVQGKLVPQIETEGNARDLLEEIKTEKAKLIKEGKLKKEKPLPPLYDTDGRLLSEVEVPFEIPENWCWCRLGEICILTSGQDLIPEQYNSKGKGIPYITGASNFSNERIIINRWTEYARAIAEKNDLLLSCKGTVGEMAFLQEEKVHIARQVMGLRFANKIDSKYMRYFIATQISDLKSKARSMIPGISRDDVIKLLIPLPPLAEQKRIVAAIEKFMPLIEEYEKKEATLKELNANIGTLTKKAILQEAVQGKLVPPACRQAGKLQAKMPTARDLLEEIKTEKAKLIKEGKLKKEKPLPPLYDTDGQLLSEVEVPFEIPENWCWCRLGEICNEIKRGKSPKYVERSDYLAFAQKCNVKTGGIDLSLALYLDENSIGRYSEADKLIQGDVIINSTGGGTMGRVGLYEVKVPNGIKGVYPDSHVTVIRSIGEINQHYVYYVLMHNQPILEKSGAGSTNQTELKPAVLANLLIPLPPLAEQKRIVAAIEKLLPPACRLAGENLGK